MAARRYRVKPLKTAELLIARFHRSSCPSGARLGFVVKVIITDGSDHTKFMGEYGKGITYPPDAARRELM